MPSPILKLDQENMMYWATLYAEHSAIRLRTRTALLSVVPDADIPAPPKPKYDHMASWLKLDEETKNAVPKSQWQVHEIGGLNAKTSAAVSNIASQQESHHAHALHRTRYDMARRRERNLSRTSPQQRRTQIETPYDAVAFFEEERCDSAIGLVREDVSARVEEPLAIQHATPTIATSHGNEAPDTTTQANLAEWRRSALLEIFGDTD